MLRALASSWWMRVVPGAVLALLVSLLTGGRGLVDDRRSERCDRSPAIVATTTGIFSVAAVPAVGLAACQPVLAAASPLLPVSAVVLAPTIRCGSALGARAPTI
jgi:hypothetical protein